MKERVPPLVWTLMIANGVFAIFVFMVMPFLALYLHRTTGASPSLVGFVVGLGALSNLLSSSFLGPLSDRLGRKRVLVLAACAVGLILIGFAFARTLLVFALLQIAMGMANALESPAFQALLTDLTPEPLRVRVFGYSYWAANVGAAIGPILGAMAGSGHSGLPFVLEGGAGLLLALGLWRLLPHGVGRAPVRHSNALESLRHLRSGLQNRALLWSLVGLALIFLAYSQMETNIAQFLGLHYTNGTHLFAYMISANAITVICLQPWLSRLQEHRPLVYGLAGGALVYTLADALFIGAHAPLTWIGLTVFFTVGEVLLAPAQQALIAQFAPADRRASYFTLQSIFIQLAFACGPTAGGFALELGGKAALFGSMALACLLACTVFGFALGRRSAAAAPDPVGAQDEG